MLGCKAQCDNLELGFLSGGTATELEKSESWIKPRYIADISGSGFLHEFALKCKQSGLRLLSLRGDSSRNSVMSQSCQKMPYSLLLSTLLIATEVVWYLPHLSYCESKFIKKCLQEHPFVAMHCQGSLWASRRNTLWLFTLFLHFPHFPLQHFRGSKQAEQWSLELRLAPLQFFWSRKA